MPNQETATSAFERRFRLAQRIADAVDAANGSPAIRRKALIDAALEVIEVIERDREKGASDATA